MAFFPVCFSLRWLDWSISYIYMYILPTNRPLFWSAGEGNRMRPLVPFVFVWVLPFLSEVICVSSCFWFSVCCIYVFVYVPIGNRCWASLLTGPGDRELCQSHFYWILDLAAPNNLQRFHFLLFHIFETQ